MSKVEYFIGGGGDKSDWISDFAGSSNIMEIVSVDRTNKSFGILIEYRGHEEEKEILSEIKKKWKSKKYTSIRLTGHSWGGQTAMNICQDLFESNIPVDELITLDPVALFPFGKVYAGQWVNVYITPSLIDSTIGKVPLLGNIVSAVFTLPTLFTNDGLRGGYIANVGGQLGAENGAYNVEIDSSHANARKMYVRARKEIKNAPVNPKAIGFR